MNIFYVDSDPVIAAQQLVDKHVVKMPLETAQLLCSAFPQGAAPYRRNHYITFMLLAIAFGVLFT